jgi:hypothetical protein
MVIFVDTHEGTCVMENLENMEILQNNQLRTKTPIGFKKCFIMLYYKNK